MKIKFCKGCNENLSTDNFTKSKNVKDGYENKCKDCRRKRRSENHKHVCLQCRGNFTSAKKDSVFCSKKCLSNSKKKKVDKICFNCGLTFEVKKSSSSNAKFCGIKCKSEWQSKNLKGEKNPNFDSVKRSCSGCGKMVLVHRSKLDKLKFCSYECYKANIGKYQTGELNVNYKRDNFNCAECGSTFEARPSHRKGDSHFCSNLCRINWMAKENEKRTAKKINVKCEMCNKDLYRTVNFIANREHIYCSVECKNKGNSFFYSGQNHPLYDNSKTERERILGRKYPEYTKWRKNIYKRDNYSCRVCGDSRGGNLVAHHLDGYTKFPEKRTETENGITLCRKCHLYFHSLYGYRDNTKTQFIQFLKQVNTEPSLIGNVRKV